MAGSKFRNKKAVALFYEQEETPLPQVIAKGEAYMAERMIQAAVEEGIPIMENVPLASALYSEVDLEHYIPSELIEPVAEVLNWVQRLKNEGASY